MNFKTYLLRNHQSYKGDIVDFKEVQLTAFEGYDAIKDNISFMQGDACNLTDKYNDYDLVFAGNLIDRLYKSAEFLISIKDRIRPGGLLVIISPYTWLEEFTPNENWLGGFKAQTGENYTTLEGLTDHLASEFEMVGDPQNIPFVIRETARKLQHSAAEMSI